VRLAERWMREAALALEDAGLHGSSSSKVAQLKQIYASELTTYTGLMSPTDEASSDHHISQAPEAL
jgi:hypothetical protein